MLKYRPRIRWSAELECEVDSPSPLTVFEVDDGVPTGILDQYGNELCKYEKIPMGFLSDA